jgi:hypothetical protein
MTWIDELDETGRNLVEAAQVLSGDHGNAPVMGRHLYDLAAKMAEMLDRADERAERVALARLLMASALEFLDPTASLPTDAIREELARYSFESHKQYVQSLLGKLGTADPWGGLRMDPGSAKQLRAQSRARFEALSTYQKKDFYKVADEILDVVRTSMVKEVVEDEADAS